MTLNEVKEQYGTGKLLNELRVKDFSKFNTIEETVYKNVQVRIEYDYFNKKWIYSSDEILFSGAFYGTLSELKNKIKNFINKK